MPSPIKDDYGFALRLARAELQQADPQADLSDASVLKSQRDRYEALTGQKAKSAAPLKPQPSRAGERARIRGLQGVIQEGLSCGAHAVINAVALATKGTLPSVSEVRAFLASNSAELRELGPMEVRGLLERTKPRNARVFVASGPEALCREMVTYAEHPAFGVLKTHQQGAPITLVVNTANRDSTTSAHWMALRLDPRGKAIWAESLEISNEIREHRNAIADGFLALARVPAKVFDAAREALKRIDSIGVGFASMTEAQLNHALETLHNFEAKFEKDFGGHHQAFAWLRAYAQNVANDVVKHLDGPSRLPHASRITVA